MGGGGRGRGGRKEGAEQGKGGGERQRGQGGGSNDSIFNNTACRPHSGSARKRTTAMINHEENDSRSLIFPSPPPPSGTCSTRQGAVHVVLLQTRPSQGAGRLPVPNKQAIDLIGDILGASRGNTVDGLIGMNY